MGNKDSDSFGPIYGSPGDPMPTEAAAPHDGPGKEAKRSGGGWAGCLGAVLSLFGFFVAALIWKFGSSSSLPATVVLIASGMLFAATTVRANTHKVREAVRRALWVGARREAPGPRHPSRSPEKDRWS